MGLLAELEVYHEPEGRSAALNMAIDEALLESARKPILRFYRWRRPALSFGYFGAFAEVAAEESQRELVRRWTGGGIVLHGDDLTYSLILPKNESSAGTWGRAVYTWIHQAIREALPVRSNISLASADAPKISATCFANAVTADVLADGRKIAGAAQRRTRAGLLHQGSIQYQALPPDFPEAFASKLCSVFARKNYATALLARAEEISAEKYATAAWLHRR
ncbi:MAG: lipoate--protein ligase family protein [Chthoniobacterales bacterium]